MNKLIVIVLICCFAILSVSAKRSKRSFVEEIVELADTERGGSMRMPTITPMRMPTFTSFAPTYRMPTISAPSFSSSSYSSFAPKMPTFTSFAPSYRMPSFSSPSFAPMRMPSFAPSYRMPSFAPMRMPSFNTPRFAPRAPMASFRPSTFASPRIGHGRVNFVNHANRFNANRNPFGSLPNSMPRNPGRLPYFANNPRNNFAPRSFGSISNRNSRLPYFANQRNPSFIPSARSFGSKPLGHGRVNFVNRANRFNGRNPFGSLPTANIRNTFGGKPLGHGRVALRNYANRFNGRNPFGSLPSQRNQQGRLPFFANPRNQQFGGKGFNPIGRNSRLPTFARQRHENFIPTRSLPTGSNRGNRGNAPLRGANPNARQAQPPIKGGGRAKSNPKPAAVFNRALDRFMKSKEGKAIKDLYNAVREPAEKIANFVKPPANGLGKYKIDREFLEAQEGFKLKAYVPPAGKSGVTVGTGFDIGQHSRSALESLGLPKKLVDKLSPYTEMKRGEAAAFLKKNPLSITTEEARAIDTAVMYTAANKLARDYESAAARHPGAIKKFTDLPGPIQSVAYSVEHQYGSMKAKTPNFFNKLATNDYKGMVGALRNFGDAYGTRRNREADYIQQRLGRE